jgi:hypothetical protein
MKATGKPLVRQVEVFVLAAFAATLVRSGTVKAMRENGVMPGQVVECSGAHPLVPLVELGDGSESPLVGSRQVSPTKQILV